MYIELLSLKLIIIKFLYRMAIDIVVTVVFIQLNSELCEKHLLLYKTSYNNQIDTEIKLATS